MTALLDRRRRLNRWMVAATFVSVVTAVLLALVGIGALRNYTAAKTVTTTTTKPLIGLPGTQTALVGTVDENNVLSSLTVFVMRSNGPGGSIVSVPVNGNAFGLSREEPQSFQQIYDAGGDVAAVEAVQGALAMTFDHWVIAESERATSLFLPVAPLPVTLPDDVMATVEGTPEPVLEAGAHELEAAEIVQVLTSRVSSAPERIRRPSIEALWAAVATHAGDGIGVAPATVDSIDALLASVYAGPVGARALQVDPSADISTAGADVEQLDVAESMLVFATIAPSAMSAPLTGKTYRLLAPPGTEAQVREAILLLMYAGGNVISVSFSGPEQDATRIFADGDLESDELAGVSGAFADAAIQATASPIEGIDVTIIFGRDYLDAVPVSTADTVPADPPATTTDSSGSEPATSVTGG